jgi:hypothetical protein
MTGSTCPQDWLVGYSPSRLGRQRRISSSKELRELSRIASDGRRKINGGGHPLNNLFRPSIRRSLRADFRAGRGGTVTVIEAKTEQEALPVPRDLGLEMGRGGRRKILLGR